MKDKRVYGFELASFAEVYLSTLSNLMEPHGIERNFVALLYIVKHSGKISQKDLADHLRKDKVYIKRTVDALSDLDLIERKTNKKDRRCQNLVATEKAIRLVPIVEEAIHQTNQILFKNFSSKEKELFANSMNKLNESIDNQPPSSYTINAYKRKND